MEDAFIAEFGIFIPIIPAGNAGFKTAGKEGVAKDKISITIILYLFKRQKIATEDKITKNRRKDECYIK